MEKAISGVVLIHAKREGRVNPSEWANARTPSKRSNPSRRPRPGDLAGAVKSSRGARERADFEYPQNTVNIDKFLKIFEGQTNGILGFNLVFCRDMLK